MTIPPYPLHWPDTMPAPGGRFINLSGQRFGSCVATSVTEKRGTKYYYLCKCDCGAEFTARGEHLKQGAVTGCGCLKAARAEAIGLANEVHGQSSSGGTKAPSLTYMSWKSMKERCFWSGHKSYARYGGRGITVCDRWLNGENGQSGFECFLADMGPRPSDGHSIDRYPDNDGNYEPGNCRWATSHEQHWTQRGKSRAKDEALREIGS